MLVTGKSVTLAQAREIIRRTDTFFLHSNGGNNPLYENLVRDSLRMPSYQWNDTPEGHRKYWDRIREWRNAWNCVEGLTYVHNSWIASSYIAGPYGWCHPDGDIGYVDNVGKWPSVEEIFTEWQILAKEFPFLDIGVTLFDGEQCENAIKPIVSMRMREQLVELVDPAQIDVHKEHPEATRAPGPTLSLEETIQKKFSVRRSNERGQAGPENAIPWDWFVQWQKEFFS